MWRGLRSRAKSDVTVGTFMLSFIERMHNIIVLSTFAYCDALICALKSNATFGRPEQTREPLQKT